MSKYFLVIICGVLVSCAGAPARPAATASDPAAPVMEQETGPAGPETEGPEAAAPETELPEPDAAETDLAVSEAAPAADEPEEEPVPAEAENVAANTEADEALVDAEAAESPAGEQGEIAALPEPELEPAEPVLPPVPEPAPAVPQPAPPPAASAPRQTPPAQPAPPPVAPSASRERSRPEPPAHLGPAEDERPSALVREPAPSITPPLPEPPAAIVPVPRPRDEELVFSRIVRATVGQLVEIPFRGTGWVYLGELGSRRGMVYDSRRLDPEGQSFVFRAEAAGTYALKFYKQDFVRDYILNDHVQVIVGEVPESAGAGWFNPPLDRGRVSAEPRWPASLEEAEIARQGGSPETAPRPAAEGGTPGTVPPSGRAESGVSPQGSAGTVSAGENVSAASPVERPGRSTAPAAEARPPVSPVPGPPAASVPPAVQNAAPEPPPDGPPETFLEKARTEFEAGRVASAISLLDRFRERYPSGSDEAYWLYGQFYEANSPSKDILCALDYYRRLVREYPQSGRYNDARRRIAYLERFYINIR